MYIVFLGAPGAGKGTQAAIVSGELKLAHIASGDLFRQAVREGTELGKKAQSYMEKGLLVPDEVTIQMVLERMTAPDCKNGVILDGFPRTIEQARALDQMLAEQSRRIDLVLALTAPTQELEQRLLKRAELEGRSDDNPTTIAQRLTVYEQQTAPVLDYYRRRSLLHEVDGLGTPDEVFQRIQDVVHADRKSS